MELKRGDVNELEYWSTIARIGSKSSERFLFCNVSDTQWCRVLTKDLKKYHNPFPIKIFDCTFRWGSHFVVNKKYLIVTSVDNDWDARRTRRHEGLLFTFGKFHSYPNACDFTNFSEGAQGSMGSSMIRRYNEPIRHAYTSTVLLNTILDSLNVCCIIEIKSPWLRTLTWTPWREIWWKVKSSPVFICWICPLPYLVAHLSSKTSNILQPFA